MVISVSWVWNSIFCCWGYSGSVPTRSHPHSFHEICEAPAENKVKLIRYHLDTIKKHLHTPFCCTQLSRMMLSCTMMISPNTEAARTMIEVWV